MLRLALALAIVAPLLAACSRAEPKPTGKRAADVAPIARDDAVAKPLFEGAYIVVPEKNPHARSYYVFLQHGDQIGLAVLNGRWFYGLGTISRDTVAGPLIMSWNNRKIGHFSVTFGANGTLLVGAPKGGSNYLAGRRFFPPVAPRAPDAAAEERRPFTGVYKVTETWQRGGPSINYYVFLQHGDQIGLAVLSPHGFWSYGFGTVNGGTATGTVMSSRNEPTGKFSVTFGGHGTLSGMQTWEVQGAGPSQSILLSGSRFFWWDREQLCREIAEVRARFGFTDEWLRTSRKQGPHHWADAEPGIVCEAQP